MNLKIAALSTVLSVLAGQPQSISAFNPVPSVPTVPTGTSLASTITTDEVASTTTATATTAPTSTTTTSTENDKDTSWFNQNTNTENAPSPSSQESFNSLSITQLKAHILQLGASLDRGQAYNPTSGAYYSGTMLVARKKIEEMIKRGQEDDSGKKYVPTSLEEMEGEWELVLTTVPHGIFRSSPFFLAVQEAFEYGEYKEAFGQPKANLFFKLHELQTCSWGASKVGRVAQRIDSKSNYIYSEFDTSLFSLTVIPILGWFKLLPTFGGCVVTASKCTLEENGKIAMVVDYTTARKVPGLSGLGKWIWSVKVPVGTVWKLLPWNNGRSATCSVDVKYLDDDFRIVEDIDGELFVYTRPVVPRDLGVIENDE